VWAALGVVVVAVVVTLVRNLDRGFDFTDEGLYLVDLRRGTPLRTDFSQAHVLLRDLTFGRMLSVPHWRAVRIVGDVAVGVVLGLAVARARPGSGRLLPSIVIVVALQLLGWAWLPMTPSYNTANAWLLGLELACLLAATSQPDRGDRLLPVLGGLLGLHLFVKPSTAVLLGCLCVAAVGLQRRRARPVAELCGAGGLSVVVLDPITSELSLGRLLEASADVARSDSYSASELTRSWATSLRDAAELSIRHGAAVVVLGLLVALCARRRAREPIARIVLVLSLVGLAAVGIGSLRADRGLIGGDRVEKSVIVVDVLLAIAALVIASRADGVAPAGRDRTILLLLAATAIGIVGTGNPPLIQLMTVAGPIGAALAIAALDRASGPDLAAAGVLVVVVLAQALQGSIDRPYRQVPLHEATVLVPELGVRTDPATADFVASVQDAWVAAGDEGSRALVLYSMSGIPFVLGVEPPGPSWTISVDDPRVCEELRDSPEELAQTRAVFVTRTPSAELERCLADAWPGFDELVEIARIDVPEVTTEREVVVLGRP
jgi:hypothetical protein